MSAVLYPLTALFLLASAFMALVLGIFQYQESRDGVGLVGAALVFAFSVLSLFYLLRLL